MFYLLFVPLIAAVLLFFVRSHKVAAVITCTASALIAGLSIWVAASYFDMRWEFGFGHIPWFEPVVFALEVVLAVYIFITGIRNKSKLVSLLALLGLVFAALHGFMPGHGGAEQPDFILDKLAIIMILIIGVIGSFICVYTVPYMRDYAHHNKDVKDRRCFFMAILFVFLFAMFGLVLSNNLTLLVVFWEITTLCSYFLIGYTRKADAKANALNALAMNLIGGVAFSIGVFLLSRLYGVETLDGLVQLDGNDRNVCIIVFLIALAGLAKAAQMPFSKWLLGAMVAPTPSSALLHSSTMVKAGVYLIVRLSPLLGTSHTGRLVTLIGAFTFISTALIAISQSDAKKILAYSTISNLGLIVMCASIGTSDSLWTAMMMIIFHSAAKSLMFLAVGSTDHLIGSRNVEDMGGLLHRSHELAVYVIIGIIGMFLAPFGMVVAKWAAMKAVIDTGNVLLLLALAYGSSITLFYWTKWLGKIVASNRLPSKYTLSPLHALETIPMSVLSVITVLTCALFPVISQSTVVPFLTEVLQVEASSPIPYQDSNILLFMMSMLFILPIGAYELIKHRHVRDTGGKALVYMAGENAGDNMTFHGSMGMEQPVQLRNWYMDSMFGERVLLQKCLLISLVGLMLGFFIIAGGVLI